MAPITGQKRKKTTEEEEEGGDDTYAPLPPLQFPIRPFFGWWDNFSKRFSGTLEGEENLASFESFMKLSRKTYNYICGIVEEEMMTKSNYTDLKHEILSLNDRVAIALRWLSSGESMATLGDLVGVHESTVSQITWCFVEAMEKKGIHHLVWPSTEEEMRKIKSKFESIAGLPNCCGAIETTKFMFCLSSSDPSSKNWCDGENNPSMILQVIVDPDMRFLDVFTGMPGSVSDLNVLYNSNFFNLSKEGKRLNGEKLKLTEEAELREYIVGDVEYPLLPWLITPNQGKKLTYDKQNFNERHYRTRKVAKQALTRLKERWRVIQGILCRPDTNRLPRIILVCCLLHNIIIDQNEEMQDEIPLTSRHSQECQQQKCKTASAQRDKLSLYLSAKLP